MTYLPPMDSPRSASIATQGAGRPVVCKRCNTLVTSSHYLVSRAYRGYRGKAALYRTVYDETTKKGPSTVQLMQTGAYTVRALTCVECNAYLGWTFERAHEASEAWKANHSILESSCVAEIDVTPFGAHDSDDDTALSPPPSADTHGRPGHRATRSTSSTWRRTLVKLSSTHLLSGGLRTSKSMETPAWE